MATHSSILAWKIPWTEEPGGVQSVGLQESDTAYRPNHHHIYINSTVGPRDVFLERCAFITDIV